MKRVYHETSANNLQQILNQGLLADTSSSLLESYEIQEDSDGYYLLPDGHDPQYYGEKLAQTILEEERPSKYPRHHECIFFFPTTELLGDLNRQAAVSVQTAAFDDRDLYQVPYTLANTVFYKTMKTFEIANHIDASVLRDAAAEYWAKTTQVSSVSEIRDDTELFTSATQIPTDYISEYEL